MGFVIGRTFRQLNFTCYKGTKRAILAFTSVTQMTDDGPMTRVHKAIKATSQHANQQRTTMKPPCISGASPETVEDERNENKASLKESQTKEDRQLPPSSSKCRMHVEVVVKSMCPTSMSALKEQWQAFLGENDMHTLLLREGTLNLSLVPEELRLCCKRASIMFDENSDAKSLM